MTIPVLSVEQVRQWEADSWKEGRSQLEVFRRVGHLVAERANRMLGPGDSVVILHGMGNNGEDALHASRLFVEHEVHRIEVSHPELALENFDRVLGLKPKLIIDGIFGTGLNRNLDAGYQTLVERVNQSGLPVLAIDTPSGLNADTGQPMGAAIRAQVTLMLGAPKRGLLSTAARSYVGRLELAHNIGLLDCSIPSDLQWTTASAFRGFPPPREAGAHKGDFGHLAIVAGSMGYHGAAILAARGAQRAQPGLISLVTPVSIYQPIASQLQSTMVHPFSDLPTLPARRSALLVGPGMLGVDGPLALREWLAQAWRNETNPMVVDASVLDLLPAGGATAGLRILTPHPGEAARLLGQTATEVQSDRPAALRAISKKFADCWVVLKGQLTLIGKSQGELFINPSGNPHLAQGGAGDILAGWIAGLLAQPDLVREVSRTLRYAVWKHGSLADELQGHRPHWTIEDLVSWPVFPAEKPRLMILPEE